MKKSKITAFLLSAVATAQALTCTASAGYIKEGDTPLYDITPTVEGEIRSVDIPDADEKNSFSVYYFYYDKNGNKVTDKSLLYIDHSRSDSFEFDMRMRIVDKKTGRLRGNYTGFTKSNKGRRYYSNGERLYGWHKIDNSWYHFNDNGYADTGRVKICGAYYTFDKNGRWLNKVSRNGLAPKDFFVEARTPVRSYNTNGYIHYGYDMETESDVEKNVKFLSADKQIFYCMFLESGFEHGKKYTFEWDYPEKITKNYLDGKENINCSYGTMPVMDYVTTISYGGKTTEILYNFDNTVINHIDINALSAYRLTSGLQFFRYNALYKKYPEPEADYMLLE